MNRTTSVLTALLGTVLLTTASWAQSPDGLRHFKINPAETKVTASVAEPMAAIRGNAVGSFKVLSGEVQGEPDSIGNTGKVELSIDAASYASGSAARDKVVKQHALEVQKFPTITFLGDGFPEIHQQGPLSAKLRVLGQLTLHGVTKQIVVPLTAQIINGRFVADGSYTFKLEEYGVKRPTAMMGLMVTGDSATIDFHVVADPA